MSETDVHTEQTTEAVDPPAAELNEDHGAGLTQAELLVREGDIAADYLERLLDIIDYDGDIDLDVENDRAVVAIVGTDLQALVGAQGETLDALQELTRLAVQQKTGERSRLMLDVSGHRQARRNELGALAAKTARTVLDAGEPVRLAPMNPFERKVVHDVISSIDGVRSESEGDEPQRRVVVLPDQ
ncbi:MAG: R3H domain-containing nucleic acid-binding protein [Actinomycetota bacterium]